jgi:ABC-type glycerol-3-phosphate transport system substrate-binding protein
MIYNGPWAISQYRDAGVNVVVVPVPPLADGTEFGGFMGVQGVLMNQFSTNKVDAANFAKWITRSDAQVSMAQLSGRIPASESASRRSATIRSSQGFGTALLDASRCPTSRRWVRSGPPPATRCPSSSRRPTPTSRVPSSARSPRSRELTERPIRT